jgi:O-antigen/teichoic acid export membrane protein
VVDQAFSSLSNFAVGVAAARVAGPAGLGGFALAYGAWLLVAALHRSLVTDPMAIEGDARQPESKKLIRRGLAAELVLGLSSALVLVLAGGFLLAIDQHTFGLALLVVAPFVPALVVQDFWRWVGFMSLTPGRSLANDTVFNCAQGAAFIAVFMTHAHSVAAVVASWGLGGLAGALYGLRQYRVAPALAGGWSRLRSRWQFSKWLAGGSLISNAIGQVYLFLVGAILGPAGLGALRAAQTLVMGPAGVLIQASGSIGLPEATKAYAESGWRGLTRVGRLVMLAGLASGGSCLLAVGLWGRKLLSLVYGAAFAPYQVVSVIFGVVLIAISLEIGPVLVLKATKHTRWLFNTTLVNLGLSVAAAAVLAPLLGVDGAAESQLGAAVIAMVMLRWYQHRAHLGVGADALSAGGQAGTADERGAQGPARGADEGEGGDEVEGFVASAGDISGLA